MASELLPKPKVVLFPENDALELNPESEGISSFCPNADDEGSALSDANPGWSEGAVIVCPKPDGVATFDEAFT